MKHATIRIRLNTEKVVYAILSETKQKDFVNFPTMQMSFPVKSEKYFESVYKVGLTMKELTDYKRKRESLIEKPDVSDEAKSIVKNLSN